MKKHKKYLVLIIFIVAIIGVIFYGFTYAKYISNSVWNYYLKSKGFYFTSDELKYQVTSKNTNTSWDGEKVNFTIKNSQNLDLVTEYDITYTASCNVIGDSASYATCKMNGSETNNFSGILPTIQSCYNDTIDNVDVTSYNKTNCELSGYKWINQVSSKELYFEVVLTDESKSLDNVTVSVNVSSTAPYSKDLSGEFILSKSNLEEENVILKYLNFSTYDKLTVINSYSIDKCIKVNWDASKIIIDKNTNEYSQFLTDPNGYINEISMLVKAKDSKSFIYYSKDLTTKYDVSQFIISQSTSCN